MRRPYPYSLFVFYYKIKEIKTLYTLDLDLRRGDYDTFRRLNKFNDLQAYLSAYGAQLPTLLKNIA